MTKFLASVADLTEARFALECSADIIDLKDPSLGALGALEPGAVRKIVKDLSGQRPISATVGDLPMEPQLVFDAVREMSVTGVDFVKFGIFSGGSPGATIEHLSMLADQGTKIVAVFFADQHIDGALVELAGQSNFSGVMVDTADKSSGALVDHMSLPEIGDFIKNARKNGLFAGVAGSLAPSHIPQLLGLRPDFIGFRGALCTEHNRRQSFEISACRIVRNLIPFEGIVQDNTKVA